jgi:catalase
VVDRMILRLAQVDTELCARVAEGLGLVVPDVEVLAQPAAPSPALAMVTDVRYPVDGRVVQILANDGADLAGIRAARDQLVAAGLAVHVVAPHKGAIAGGGRRRGDELTVDRSFLTACSAEADALIIAGGTALAGIPAVVTYVQEAYRHHKTVGAWGDGATVLDAAGIPAAEPGVVVGDRPSKSLVNSVLAGLGGHRHWDRAPQAATARTDATEA